MMRRISSVTSLCLHTWRLFLKSVFVLLCTTLLSLSWANGGIESIDYSQELKNAERLIYKEKYSAALETLQGITEAEPDNADAWNLTGFAARKSDDLEAARVAYEQALSIKPDHKGALEYQGELYIRLGDTDAAIANMKKLTALCPHGCEELDLLQQALGGS